MSSFKIKSNLDIGGNQLLNYCVGTYDDLTSVNRNPGYKLFYVPQSTENEWYRRELIFDGSNWHAAAYLDDIDKITNGEGSLGTRVKALEDMLNVDSAETVVSTWEEIQAFLDNVKEGTDLMTMLDGKLDKTGGTISGSLEIALNLVIQGRIKEYGIMEFRHPDGEFVYLANGKHAGVLSDADLGIYTDGTWKAILHEGNVGDYTAGAANRLANKVSLWGNEFDGTQSIGRSIVFSKGFATMYVPIEDGGSNIEFLYVNPGGHLLLGQGLARNEKNTFIYGNNIKFCYGTLGTSANTAMTITDGGNIEIAGANNAYTRKLAVGVGGAHIIATTTGLPSLGTPSTHSLLVGSVHYGLQIGTNTNNEASFIQAQRFNSADAKTLNLNPLGGAVYVGEGGLNVADHVNIGTMNRAILYFNRNSANYIWAEREGGYFVIGVKDVGSTSGTSASLIIGSASVTPGERNNAVSLGTSSYRWSNVYSTLGDFNGAVTIHSNVDGAELLRFSTDRPWMFSQLGTGAATSLCLSPDATSKKFIIADADKTQIFVFTINGEYSHARFDSLFSATGLASFNGGALIPTGQKLTIGDATIEYDSIAKAIKVDGNLYTTGTNASGGKADAQQGGTGGNAEVHEYPLDLGTDYYEIINPKGSTNVIVQVYEWNANARTWDMILTDVSVNEANIFVTFVGNTSVKHLVTVV